MNNIEKIDYSLLKRYIPENGIFYIKKWLEPYWFHVVIKNPRNTKLGDYKLARKGEPHIITINSNMSLDLTFLTLTHEIAHLITYALYYPKKILPHGKEWKNLFGDMILESLEVYNKELHIYLKSFSKKPKANFYSDLNLSEYFMREKDINIQLLKELNDKELFKLKNRIFLKLDKLRSRYICEEKGTNKRYIISGNIPVEKI